MKNIVFIANYNKTMFFYKVSEELKKNQYRVFWISPNTRWTKWLVQQGIEKKTILNIPDFGEEWEKKDNNIRSLNSLEDENFCINNVILMDRLLKEKKYAKNYLKVSSKEVILFLKDNKIDFVFSEHTWALEIIISRICAILNIKNFKPHTIRIPDGRFGFFNGYLENKLTLSNKRCSHYYNIAGKFYDEYLDKKPKPRYWHLNNKNPKLHLVFLIKWIKHLIYKLDKLDSYDETKFPMKYLIKIKIGEIINNFQIKIFKPFQDLNEIDNKPFVLYALHKQPEASIDVLGSYFSNQIELIKRLARGLPNSHYLYVKEHSNSIGERSLSFYNELKKIPGVKLISPFLDSHELIKKADLVVTVSGTIAYEAALLGKPAVTVADMFFKEILIEENFNPYVTNLSEIIDRINALSRDTYSNKNKKIKFLTKIYANTYEGIISDPVSDPMCVTRENILKVAEGFDNFMKSFNQNNEIEGV